MNRTFRTAIAALVAATMTTTALAASGEMNPKAMVLQKSDLPAGARLTDEFGGKNPDTNEWAVEWAYKIGAKQFTISNEVVVLSPHLADQLRDPSLRRSHALVLARIGLVEQGYRQITLPKYGDEQWAGFSRKGNFGHGEGTLVVMKGRVSWYLGVKSPSPVSPDDGVLTKAEAIAQLKRYAPKVMKRVGSG